MEFKLGEKYLITTDHWFIAPDGEQYKSAFGTVSEILNDGDALGIKTNRHSSNWYVLIGSMMIAGCQIHYCIKTDKASKNIPAVATWHEGEFITAKDAGSKIYFAD